VCPFDMVRHGTQFSFLDRGFPFFVLLLARAPFSASSTRGFAFFWFFRFCSRFCGVGCSLTPVRPTRTFPRSVPPHFVPPSFISLTSTPLVLWPCGDVCFSFFFSPPSTPFVSFRPPVFSSKPSYAMYGFFSPRSLHRGCDVI